jgi:hypothetical protein
MTRSNATTRPTPAPRPRWLKTGVWLAVVLGAAAVLWAALPKDAYDTDLTRIGAGIPALVITHDAMYMGGMAAKEVVGALRDDYAERVAFLVADVNTPAGMDLAHAHGVHDGVVLLFGPDGTHRATLVPEEPDALRRIIDAAFGF